LLSGTAGLVFALLGIETKGRSIEEIGYALDAPAPVRVAATQV
jgi:hypothetical protein